MTESDDIKRRGYLHLYNPLVSKWNRRYLVVCGDKLAIYVNEKGKVLNEYTLQRIPEDDPAAPTLKSAFNREFVLTLTAGKKTLTFSCHNKVDLEKWREVFITLAKVSGDEDLNDFEAPILRNGGQPPASPSPASPLPMARNNSFSINTSIIRSQNAADPNSPTNQTALQNLSLENILQAVIPILPLLEGPAADPAANTPGDLLTEAAVDVKYFKELSADKGSGFPIDYTAEVIYSTNGKQFKPYHAAVISAKRAILLFNTPSDITMYENTNKPTYAQKIPLNGAYFYECSAYQTATEGVSCYELMLPAGPCFFSAETSETIANFVSMTCKYTLTTLVTTSQVDLIKGNPYHRTVLGRQGYLATKSVGHKRWNAPNFFRIMINARGVVCLVEYKNHTSAPLAQYHIIATSGEIFSRFMYGLPANDPWAGSPENHGEHHKCITVINGSDRLLLKAESESDINAWLDVLLLVAVDDWMTEAVQEPPPYYEELNLPFNAGVKDIELAHTRQMDMLETGHNTLSDDEKKARRTFLNRARKCLIDRNARGMHDFLVQQTLARSKLIDRVKAHASSCKEKHRSDEMDASVPLFFRERMSKRCHVPESSIYVPPDEFRLDNELCSTLLTTKEQLEVWTKAQIAIARRRGDEANLEVPSLALNRIRKQDNNSQHPGATLLNRLRSSFPPGSELTCLTPMNSIAHLPFSREDSDMGPSPRNNLLTYDSEPTTPTKDMYTSDHESSPVPLADIAGPIYASPSEDAPSRFEDVQAQEEAKLRAKIEARRAAAAKKREEEEREKELEKEREKVRQAQEEERLRVEAAAREEAEKKRREQMDYVDRLLDDTVLAAAKELSLNGVDVIKIPQSSFGKCSSVKLFLRKVPVVVNKEWGTTATIYSLQYFSSKENKFMDFFICPTTKIELNPIVSKVDKQYSALSPFGMTYNMEKSIFPKKSLAVLFGSDVERQKFFSIVSAIMNNTGSLEDPFWKKFVTE